MRIAVSRRCTALIVLALAMTAGCSQHDESMTATTPTPSQETESKTDGHLNMGNENIGIDDFLSKWDRFAQGENDLVPEIKNSKSGFEIALAKLLRDRDPRAPSRLVFYAVVQIGGFINADSELGVAAKPILGHDFKITTTKDGTDSLFAGDLYFWWLDHKTDFDSFPLLDEWQQRDFTKSVAIPMYGSVRQNE
jgi:hypothetical protein